MGETWVITRRDGATKGETRSKPKDRSGERHRPWGETKDLLSLSLSLSLSSLSSLSLCPFKKGLYWVAANRAALMAFSMDSEGQLTLVKSSPASPSLHGGYLKIEKNPTSLYTPLTKGERESVSPLGVSPCVSPLVCLPLVSLPLSVSPLECLSP